MIEAAAIVLYGNDVAEQGFKQLVESSEAIGNDFDITKFSAVGQEDANRVMKEHGLKWTYPWTGQKIDLQTGLTLTAYPTLHPMKRVGCALSHYLLWKKVAASNRSLLILEHDALFINKVDISPLSQPYNILGINNPIGATRRAKMFFDKVREGAAAGLGTMAVPHVDSWHIPQGLAGNSAYIITPTGARKMLELAATYGLWPNDALMCYQLYSKIGVTTTFYTRVQGLPSTTTQ